MVDASSTFDASQALCESNGGTLATIHNFYELRAIQEVCNENGASQLCWVGGTHDNTGDTCTYSWYDGSEWDYEPPRLPEGSETNTYSETGREGVTFHINCGTGGAITTLSARYGNNCPNGGVDATSRLSSTCNGQESCSFNPNNGIFGDPCGGIYKYFPYSYQCVEVGEEKCTSGETHTCLASAAYANYEENTIQDCADGSLRVICRGS